MRVTEKSAIEYATELGIVVGNETTDKHYVYMRIWKGDKSVTIQRKVSERGNCWKVYGNLTPKSKTSFSKGEAIEVACDYVE